MPCSSVAVQDPQSVARVCRVAALVEALGGSGAPGEITAGHWEGSPGRVRRWGFTAEARERRRRQADEARELDRLRRRLTWLRSPATAAELHASLYGETRVGMGATRRRLTELVAAGDAVVTEERDGGRRWGPSEALLERAGCPRPGNVLTQEPAVSIDPELIRTARACGWHPALDALEDGGRRLADVEPVATSDVQALVDRCLAVLRLERQACEARVETLRSELAAVEERHAVVIRAISSLEGL